MGREATFQTASSPSSSLSLSLTMLCNRLWSRQTNTGTPLSASRPCRRQRANDKHRRAVLQELCQGFWGERCTLTSKGSFRASPQPFVGNKAIFIVAVRSPSKLQSVSTSNVGEIDEFIFALGNLQKVLAEHGVLRGFGVYAKPSFQLTNCSRRGSLWRVLCGLSAKNWSCGRVTIFSGTLLIFVAGHTARE